MPRAHAPLSVVLLCAVLAGCTGTTPTPSSTAETPSPPATDVASPTPDPDPTTAEPTAEPTPSETRPDPGDLVTSTSGLGPLTIGLPPATNPGAAMIAFDPEYCYSEEMGLTEGNLGRWASTYDTIVDAYGSEQPLFRLAADDAAVLWIDVVDPAVPTTEGIRVGSTLEELQAAYPELVAGTPGPVSEVWWVADDAGTLVFETQDDTTGLQPPGTPPTVILIRVLAADLDPDWPAANSGDVAGACF